jgi:hypothetical protein
VNLTKKVAVVRHVTANMLLSLRLAVSNYYQEMGPQKSQESIMIEADIICYKQKHMLHFLGRIIVLKTRRNELD